MYCLFFWQGLANALGQFLGIFQCAADTDHTSMAKIIQGSAMVSNGYGTNLPVILYGGYMVYHCIIFVI